VCEGALEPGLVAPRFLAGVIWRSGVRIIQVVTLGVPADVHRSAVAEIHILPQRAPEKVAGEVEAGRHSV
jgi:hypothetical protein